VIMVVGPRIYYLFPAFPVLFAGGGVLWEQWLARPRLGWVKPAYGALMVLAGALLAPTLIPLLPAETYIRYTAATHLQQPRLETHNLGPLPQLFADQFGWQEMAATVAGVYKSLPADVRARTGAIQNPPPIGRNNLSVRFCAERFPSTQSAEYTASFNVCTGRELHAGFGKGPSGCELADR